MNSCHLAAMQCVLSSVVSLSAREANPVLQTKLDEFEVKAVQYSFKDILCCLSCLWSYADDLTACWRHVNFILTP